MTTEEIHDVATKIADDLFRNGSGQVATQLELKVEDWSDGVRSERAHSGWSRGALANRIATILSRESDD